MNSSIYLDFFEDLQMPVLIFPPIGICMLCCQPESFCSLRHHFHSSVIKTILMQTNKISNKQKSKFLKKIQNIYLIHVALIMQC